MCYRTFLSILTHSVMSLLFSLLCICISQDTITPQSYPKPFPDSHDIAMTFEFLPVHPIALELH